MQKIFRFTFLFITFVATLSAFSQSRELQIFRNGILIKAYPISEIDSVKIALIPESVDLGLPSGTLWATCNVGASSPEEYGDFFAWGETETKDPYNYSWGNYKHCNGSYTSLTKYNTYGGYGTVDNKTELDPEDDAAYLFWGPDWRMPSYDQFNELINSSYTTITKVTLNGVEGKLITSKSNGKSIFLPAAWEGYQIDVSQAIGTGGGYWSRTLYTSSPNFAYRLLTVSNDIILSYYYRCQGHAVRPVRDQ